MADLNNVVIRMKLEKLRLELQQGPDTDAIQMRVEWVRRKLEALVEILLYLGT